MILDLIALDNSSKVWVYQAKETLSDDQAISMRDDLYEFLDQWTSHNARLYTYGNIFHNRFLTIFVDERFSGASGCSIDKSVHFIQMLEKKYAISLMERTDVVYMEKAEDSDGEDISKLFTIPLAELKQSYDKGKINDETFVFDNLVKTKGEFLNRWVTPLGNSWHKRFV